LNSLEVGGYGERKLPTKTSSPSDPAAQPETVSWVMLAPPLTEEKVPLAVLNSPPLTTAIWPLASLPRPPLTEELEPLAILSAPPLAAEIATGLVMQTDHDSPEAGEIMLFPHYHVV
jgi:hypothetical protein